MKEKSLKLNSVMNSMKTLMSMVLPLVTYPYVLRVLGAGNVGKFNYANSIVSYFALLAGLGISRYAVREGARKRDNREAFSEFAGQMLAISAVSTVAAYILLFGFTLFSGAMKPYQTLIWIQSISIFCTMIGMDWVNASFEEYTYITVRTIAFQLLSIILVFSMVHNPGDVENYAWISVITNVGANVLNIFYIRRFTDIRITLKGAKQHLGPILWLFSSCIASTIYVNSDTTMLGYFCGDVAVGVYGVATKIYSIMQQLLAASILVTLPRLSNYYANNRKEDFRNTVSGVFITFITFLLPAAVGLCILAPEAVEIVGGSEYALAATPLRILCVSLIFSIFATFLTNTMLLPLKMERQVTIIMIVAAVVNFTLNLWFIPAMRQVGAAFTTAIAEFLVMTMQLLMIRKEKLLTVTVRSIIGPMIGCVGIAVFSVIVHLAVKAMIPRVFLTILGSVLLYYCTLSLLKHPIAVTVNAYIRRFLSERKERRENS